jgi:predicted double-glycine peptidase
MVYAQLIAFPLLAFGGWFAGRRLALHRRWWVLVVAGFALFAVVIAGHRVPRLSVIPPMSWTISPAMNPFLMTAAIALVFGILLPKLAPGRARPAARIVLVAMTIYYGLLPPALVLASRLYLERIPTRFDLNRVCRQSTSYTCGPAAAVTCLMKIGIDARESDLAVRAQSTPSFGTDAPRLAAAVNDRFPEIRCVYGYFDSLDAIPLPAVADCMLPRIGGHYVALLEVNGEYVVVGDPLSGRQKLSRGQFMQEWKGTAIAFERR